MLERGGQTLITTADPDAGWSAGHAVTARGSAPARTSDRLSARGRRGAARRQGSLAARFAVAGVAPPDLLGGVQRPLGRGASGTRSPGRPTPVVGAGGRGDRSLPLGGLGGRADDALRAAVEQLNEALSGGVEVQALKFVPGLHKRAQTRTLRSKFHFLLLDGQFGHSDPSELTVNLIPYC